MQWVRESGFSHVLPLVIKYTYLGQIGNSQSIQNFIVLLKCNAHERSQDWNEILSFYNKFLTHDQSAGPSIQT